MAVAGRKPKPTNLRLIEGNREHRPIHDDVKPVPLAPSRPDWVDGKAAEIWDEYAPKLERLGILTEIDGLAFGALCVEMAEYIKMRGDATDSVQEFSTGARQVAPEITIAHKCLDKARALFAEFGLTPSSRARLSIGGDDGDEWEEFLN